MDVFSVRYHSFNPRHFHSPIKRPISPLRRNLLLPPSSSSSPPSPLRLQNHSFSLWSRIKDLLPFTQKTTKEDDEKKRYLRETQTTMNQMIDESTRGLSGISGFLFRSLLKRLSKNMLSIGQQSLELLKEIERQVHQSILEEPACQQYFGNSIEISSPQNFQVFEVQERGGGRGKGGVGLGFGGEDGKSVFQFQAIVQGIGNGKVGTCQVKGSFRGKDVSDVIIQKIVIFDRNHRLLASQTWDESHQHHYNKRKVIVVEAKEVKE